jgi:hypothetical protein
MKEKKIPIAWHLVYILLAAVVGYLYYKKIVLGADPEAANSIDAVLSFSTGKPYQFRLFVPFLFALFKPVSFISQHVIFGIYNSAVLYILLLAYHKLLCLFFSNKKLILIFAPVILYPILWNYILLNETFQYYDFTAVLICTLGLYFIVREKFGIFRLILFIGLLNKESAAYLIFSYLLFNYKNIFTKKIIFNTAIIAAMIILVKVALGYIFKNNPGDNVEITYGGNFEIISSLFSNRIYLRSIALNYGALYIFAVMLFVTGVWKKFPDRRLVLLNLTIVPYYILGILVTYISEVRVYAELIPMITTLFLIYLSSFNKLNLKPVGGKPVTGETVAGETVTGQEYLVATRKRD